MKTGHLAVYLILFVAVTSVLFGIVPGMLNAPNSFLNAIGAAVAVAVVVAAALVGHATWEHSREDEKKGK